MTRGFEHLCRYAHSLQQYQGEVGRMVGALGTASGGEGVMIRAALSFLPHAWLDDASQEVEPFRLHEICRLDGQNAQVILEALALESDLDFIFSQLIQSD